MKFGTTIKLFHMKKLIFTFLFLTTIKITTIAQDTTMVERYCRMIISERALSTKVNIELDFGEARKLFAGDVRLKDELTGKLKKFNSGIDALNYMGLQGWIFVNAFPIGDSRIYHYYFKKHFKRSEIN